MPEAILQLDGTGSEALARNYARAGWAVVGPPVLGADAFSALRSEAARQRALAAWPLHTGDGRSRVPEQNVRAQFGRVAIDILSSAELRRLVHAVTGRELVPSWKTSCYTYYEGRGAFLGRHCDRLGACALAVLIGIESAWEPPGPRPGNQLWIYDARGESVQTRVTTFPNRALILNGERFPHERPPLGAGEQVTVLSGCFWDPNG